MNGTNDVSFTFGKSNLCLLTQFRFDAANTRIESSSTITHSSSNVL